MIALLALLGCPASPPTPTPADTDPPTDTDPPVDTDTDVELPTNPVVHSHYDAACPLNGSIAPGASEVGHWVATRITPSQTPFLLTEVHAFVWNNAQCDATSGFALSTWITRDISPAATPDVLQVWLVPPDPGAGNRRVTGALDAPALVRDGEHVFVALQLPATNTCAVSCDTNLSTDRDYWSNAAFPPYAWVTLESFGIDDDWMMEIAGLGP